MLIINNDYNNNNTDNNTERSGRAAVVNTPGRARVAAATLQGSSALRRGWKRSAGRARVRVVCVYTRCDDDDDKTISRGYASESIERGARAQPKTDDVKKLIKHKRNRQRELLPSRRRARPRRIAVRY